MDKRHFVFAFAVTGLLFTGLCGCNGLVSPEIDLKDVKLEDWPLTDCSTSTRPVRDLVAYKLYQFLFSKKGADIIDESGYIAIDE